MQIHNSLEVLAQKIARIVFRRFPQLADKLLELTGDLLNQEKEKTRVVIENIISAETEYLFTNDVTYLQEHGTMERVTDLNQNSNLNQNQNQHTTTKDQKPDKTTAFQASSHFIAETATTLKQG